MKAVAFGLAAGLGSGFASICLAGDMVAAEQVSGTSVGFVLSDSHRNATLTIAGPNDFQARTFSRGGAVAIDLSRHGPLPDGIYNYQLTAAGSGGTRVENSLNDGRSGGRKAFAQKPAAKSGTFRIKDGRIVDYGSPARTGRHDRDSR